MTGVERTRRYVESHREQVNLRAKLAERRKRRARQLAARLQRPRCMICNNPIQYGKPGVSLKSKTCGKLVCQQKRYRWFVAREKAA